jgi:hypothetical protein
VAHREVRSLDVRPTTDVFQLKIYGDEVQFCVVRASKYYYFLLCSTWLEQCNLTTLVLNRKSKNGGKWNVIKARIEKFFIDSSTCLNSPVFWVVTHRQVV